MKEQPPPFKNYFPKLSLRVYFWIVVGISAIVFGILGYLVGFCVYELPSSSSQPATVMTNTNEDNEEIFARISGTFTVETGNYEQLAIGVDSIKNGVPTGLDNDFRDITRPQVGVVYPFSFSRLDPSKTYMISASACSVNKKTYALNCVKKIIIKNCTGTVQGDNCFITWQGRSPNLGGSVDFSVAKGD